MTIAVAAVFLVSLATAQYTINPDEVPLKTRQGWCSQQISLCPALCTQVTPDQSTNTDSNTCDPTTLEYSCICSTGGITPNGSQFSQTIPYFICQQYNADCITACNGENLCQGACQSDHPCGAQNPVRVNTTSSTSTSSATATESTSTSSTSTSTSSTRTDTTSSSLGTSAAVTSSSSKKNGAQSAIDMGRIYGLGVVTAGLFAGFAFMI